MAATVTTKAKTIAAISAVTRLYRDRDAGRITLEQFARDLPIREAIANDYRAQHEAEVARFRPFAQAAE